jgi:hypothetical protein
MPNVFEKKQRKACEPLVLLSFFNIMFISLYKSLSVCKRFSIQYFSSKIRLSIGQLSIN